MSVDTAPSLGLQPPAVQTRRQLGIVLATLALDAIGLGVATPVLPDLLKAAGVAAADVPTTLGTLLTGFAFMQFVFGSLWGTLSDAWGRRPVLLLTLFGTAAAFALGASAHSFGGLLAAHLLAGCTAAGAAAATAYLADVTPPADRSRRFGLAGAVLGLGLIAGPAFGGLLGALGPRVPFVAAGVLAVLNFLGAVFLLTESLPPQRRTPFAWRRAHPFGSLALVRDDKVFRTLAGAICLGMTAYGIFLACFVVSNQLRLGWGPAENGLALAALGLGIVMTQSLLLPKVLRRLGEYRSALIGYALFVAAYVVYSGAGSFAWLAMAIGLHSLALLSDPPLRALVSVRAGAGRQGEYQGALVCLSGLAASLAPLVGARSFEFFTQANTPALFFPGAPFLLAAALYGAAFVAVLRCRALRNPATLAQHLPPQQEDIDDPST
ncbi:MFS transporter [Caldimonas brevitalea]|uniref:Major facilitator superfamily transporter n=1 Tax=Caldimonas brevitalea TaxID=413882 RepID=A8KCJ0_9BURK|nr:MFS transporter [Caldimonas brevitalea]AKJ29079.1 tetracycline resistance MFS efflux pump [Caldimonas brevitalea]CAL80822.1 major facilitator superfamily transporter [Caldimonas brevitalea]